MKRFRIALAFTLLTGCAGLISVPDLTFDEKAGQGSGSADGSSGDGSVNRNDGSLTNDGGGGGDATITCDQSLVATDKLNCGRCGHDCGGGDCIDSVCKPFQLSAISNAPIRFMAEHGNALYLSTLISYTTELGGIWKAPKTTGNAVLFVDIRYAQRMTVVGDTLYFVVSDEKFDDDAGKTGGLWSCDLNGPTPCVPKLVAAAESPQSLITGADGKIYYGDDIDTRGIMQYSPGTAVAPTIYRQGWGHPPDIYVDNTAYYLVSLGFQPSQERAVLFEIYPDAGDATQISQFLEPKAAGGELAGGKNALYYTAYHYDTTTGGVVRRVSRPGTPGIAPCDYAGITNKRPYGLYLDGKWIYWTNLGDPTPPYANGSLSYCELDGCCTEAKTPWTGSGEPGAMTGDDKAVYWTTRQTGVIWKVAKP